MKKWIFLLLFLPGIQTASAQQPDIATPEDRPSYSSDYRDRIYATVTAIAKDYQYTPRTNYSYDNFAYRPPVILPENEDEDSDDSTDILFEIVAFALSLTVVPILKKWWRGG